MGRSKIFLVDDDPVFIKILHHSFEAKKVKGVVDFSSGEECLANLNKRPALVLLDFSMKGLNGLDVLRQIKKQTPKTNVIILTGLEDTAVKQKCLEEGASEYIVKNETGLDHLRENIIPQYKSTGLFSLFN